MTKIERIPFHVKHLELAHLKECEFQGVVTVDELMIRMEVLAKQGEALTLIVDGRIICFTGFYVMWTGVAEVWLLPTYYMGQSVWFSRVIKNYLDILVKQFNLHRLQTLSIDDVKHTRFMRFLNFKCEGLMEKYTPNKQSYKMWARIK